MESNSDKSDALSRSFEKSLNSDAIIDLAGDYSELALDDLIDNPVLKEIPLIKTLLAFGKFGRSIRDAFNVRKLTRFLFKIKAVSEEEKQKFLKVVDKSSDKGKIFEQILILIDRHEDERKTDLLANLFTAYLKGKISQLVFFKLTSVIDQVSIWDLLLIKQRLDHGEADELDLIEDELSSIRVNKALSYHSLLEEKIHASDRLQRLKDSNGLDYRFEYKATELGRVFFKYAYSQELEWL